MADIKANTSAASSLTITGLATLAAATYAVSGAIDLSAVDPLDLLVGITVTPGTVSGNKQLLVFAKASLDGTNYTTGPESGSSAVDEPNLYLLGALPLNTNTTAQRGVFSVASALGYVPPYLKIVVRNDSGAAFTAGSAQYATQAGVSV
ncbi:MAG TPA: hypothetical protein P5024_11470 [Burkholderiaceae bacterium]|nr:hypothetical protein [Rubrivivax sp.]HRZ02167.1 hypothetical protein [Burkholderiaceae bacterium]HRZ59903.1 hypothetical protein [Rubrivivax sp.]